MAITDTAPDLARPPWAGATQTADEAVEALLAVARRCRTHAETAAALPEPVAPRSVARWWAWLREHRPGLELPPREDGTPEAAAHARAHLRRAHATG